MSVTPLPLAAALKDAAMAALVAFGLFFFLIGLHTDQGPTGALVVTPRWTQLAIIVGAVFLGAFARALIFGREPVTLGRAMPAVLSQSLAKVGRLVGPALLAFALLVPVLFYHDRYLLDLGILVLTYVMLGWGLNIVVGLLLNRIQGRRRILDPDHRADLPADRHPRPARGREGVMVSRLRTWEAVIVPSPRLRGVGTTTRTDAALAIAASEAN